MWYFLYVRAAQLQYPALLTQQLHACRTSSRKHCTQQLLNSLYCSHNTQGAVILSLLLLVLWLPPLIFSSGAPTYTTPSIESVKLNVTISQVGACCSSTTAQ